MADLIETYAERLRARGRSHETIYSRTRCLRHADALLPHGLAEACGDEIVAYLATKKALWTKNTYYYALKGFYATMAKAKGVYDPMETVDAPQGGDSEPDPVTDDELAIALRYAPDRPWRRAVILAAYAGLRCCELVKLEGTDVTRERVHVKIGKGGKGRFIPTHPLVWELREEVGDGHFITNRFGRPMKPNGLSCNQREIWERIGLKDVHLHRFRHWFATALVEQDVGIDVVSQLMGHASVSTTMGYVRVATRRKAAAILTLPLLSSERSEPESSRLGPPTAEAA